LVGGAGGGGELTLAGAVGGAVGGSGGASGGLGSSGGITPLFLRARLCQRPGA